MKECNFTGSEKVSDSKYNDSANNDKEKEAFKLTNELKDKSYDKDFKPSHELKSKSDDRKFKPFHESKNKENKWDKIDWNKINSDKKSPNKWDEVDWNNLNSKKEKLDEKNTKDNLNVKVKDNTMKSEIKDDNTNEIKTNDVNKNNFKNLSNDIVNTHFKQYRNETKKFPNKGLELTIEFIKWIENEENVIIEKNELIKAYYDINNTQEIPSYISFQNKNTDFTAYKISDDLFKLGLNISGKEIYEILNQNNEIKLDNSKIEKMKEEIKNINWNKISNDWIIKQHITNQYSELITIQLDPTQDVSNANPLYKHKDWMQRVYNDLNDRQIADICGVNPSTIGYWRRKHDIPVGIWGKGKWIDDRSGRIYIRVPKDYDHPELNNIEKKRNYRLEHIYNMEQHLIKHPEWQISKECLINGKYLKKGCEVHHINQNPADNRIENLWLYESKMEHAEGELTLYKSLKELIKKGQIRFNEGIYSPNQNSNQVEYIDNPDHQLKELINYKNLDVVHEEIKKINWNNINSDWNIKERKNQFAEREITVDPTKECSITNPLYKHKVWVEFIVKESKYNLTDSRLGELCGISRDKARYWRDKVHNITGKKEWGYDRIVDKSDGRIWIKISSDYENPVVKKDDHQRKFMLEHRYIMERHLAEHPFSEISKVVLINGKYLKPESEVHHINLDFQDNRIENLWVCRSSQEHKAITKFLYSLADVLLENKTLIFKDGNYKIG